MANGLSGMSGLAQKSISQTAHLIQTKQISPVEIVESVISNVEALDADLRAYVSVHPENALIQARQAEAEMSAGHYRGPMHGIPICIKDNIAVAGWPTTNGSVLMAKNVTDYDARVVTRLKGAGAIILGKNNMHEWAMGGTCSGMYYGTVRNPWDTSRIPGGSSGGSAAAVSACLALASIGTDGMGSIRAPAAFCGVVGMKPTYGLISRFGELPATSSWIDHLGPIA